MRIRAPYAILYALDQRPIHFLLIAALATLVAMSLPSPWMNAINDASLDVYFRVRGARTPQQVARDLPGTKDIVMVEMSYLAPRELQAKLLKQLRLAKVVAFDFMFVDKARELDAEEKKRWYQGDIERWKRETEPLVNAVSKDGNVILGAWPEQVPDSSAAGLKMRRIWEYPPVKLWKSARYHAHLEVQPGFDGAVRHVQLFEKTGINGAQELPCLGLAIAAAQLDVSPEELSKAKIENGILHLGKHRIEVGNGTMLIDYLGPRASFESMENYIVYKRVFDYFPEDFAGKIVIVGESSLKSKEIFETPFGLMPGMQIHANIAATLLGKTGAPRVLPSAAIAAIAFLCCLLLIAPLLRWPLWASLVSAIVLGVGVLALGALVFARGHRVLPPAAALLAIVLTYNAVALYEYRRARETLGRFIGREMVAPTLSLFSRLRLGGRVEEASAMFCDLRGYSAFSELAGPQSTADAINEYTSTLVAIVEKYGGRPIDYQGDGVFVLFEKSLAGEDFAWKSVLAAIELSEKFVFVREKWKDEGDVDEQDLPQIAVGIDTGPMMIGLIGAENHLKQGAIGDAVNIAARVQQLSSQYCYNILLTAATCSHASSALSRQDLVPVPCGSCTLRGRSEPVEVFGIEPNSGRSQSR